jgi:hypothetical protein
VIVNAGVTPFAGGQWGSFMARLAGLWALQQILRPLRFSCAMALTPLVDRMMGALQLKFKLTKQKAFLCMFVLLAVVTTAAFAVALTLATVLSMPQPVV